MGARVDGAPGTTPTWLPDRGLRRPVAILQIGYAASARRSATGRADRWRHAT
jgi:hypothetical protein